MQTGGGAAGQFPFWLAALRFIITGAVLIIPAFCSLRRRKISLRRNDWIILCGLGLIGVTAMSAFFHLAILYLPANIAALVFSCNPVFVVLFAAVILKEKITAQKLGAAILSLGGIIILAAARTGAISPRGLLLMIFALLAFAVYTVLFKKAAPRYGALPITALASLTGGLFLLPLAIGIERWPFAAYTGVDWIGISYLALIGTALAYFLFIYGISRVEAGIGSMTFFLKPFLAALFSWMLLDETITAPILAGGAFILAGMVVALFRNR